MTSDPISRQAVKRMLCDSCVFCTVCKDKECNVTDALNAIPTIDPVKHGKWIPHPTDADWDICSVCGTGTQKIFHCNDAVYGVYDVDIGFAYCPRCGARMDSE